jgi:GDP/UDP-N,N'-diacetylbacillosamine 2-epimerase (hydrolysing)
MIEVIKKYEGIRFIKAFRSLPRDKYLALMSAASVMVGNSSSGIIEAPSFRLPVVNIGIRQEGRDRAENVIDVGHDKEKIKAAIRKALDDKKFLSKVKNCLNPYGDGKASERIVAILRKTEITSDLLRKRITY